MKTIKRPDFDELMKGANSYNDSARRQAADKVWQIVADAQRDADWELQASRLAAVEAQQAMTIAEDQVRETVRLRLEIVRLEAERAAADGEPVPEPVDAETELKRLQHTYGIILTAKQQAMVDEFMPQHERAALTVAS